MNYYAEWWEKARKSTGILTKQTYLKQLEQELAQLKANPNYQHLAQQISQLKTKYEKVRKELAENDEIIDKLAEKNQAKDQTITDLQEQIKLLESDKQNLSQLSAQEIKKLEQEKEQIKQSFTNGSAVGTTHLIYWKTRAEEQNSNLQKQVKALTILANHRLELLEQEKKALIARPSG